MSITDSQADAGTNIKVAYTVSNQGGLRSTFGVGIYLSRDATITTADIRLRSPYRYKDERLGGNNSTSSSRSYNLPLNLDTGTYYVGAIADYKGKVIELNEDNNTAVASTTLQVGE